MIDTAVRFGPRETGLLFLLASMWGLSFLYIEVALEAVAPIWIVVARVTIGAIVLLLVLVIRRGSLPRDPRIWGHLAILGVLNNAVPWTAVAYAQQSLSSGQTALLMAMVPTSTLLISVTIRLERLNSLKIAGLLTALTGVGLMVADDLSNPGRVLAMLTVLGATVLYAIGSVYAKRTVSGRVPPLTLATGQVLSSAILWLPVGFLVAPPPGAEALQWQVVASLLALGSLGTGFAFLVFYVLIERVGATNATMVTYLVPVIAVVAGIVVLGERLGVLVLAGGVFVGFGIWLTQRGSPRAPAEALARAPR
jgi:drug/metabolite transporter (DMT)-like permease